MWKLVFFQFFFSFSPEFPTNFLLFFSFQVTKWPVKPPQKPSPSPTTARSPARFASSHGATCGEDASTGSNSTTPTLSRLQKSPRLSDALISRSHTFSIRERWENRLKIGIFNLFLLQIRLSRAHTLALHGEKLPKAEWTQWDQVAFHSKFNFKKSIFLQESWYLKPYLDEIEAEKKARAETSGLIPPYQMKQH